MVLKSLRNKIEKYLLNNSYEKKIEKQPIVMLCLYSVTRMFFFLGGGGGGLGG